MSQAVTQPVRHDGRPSLPATDTRGRSPTAASVADTAAVGHVLVVDDHARARESIADILRQAGHRAECCSSGREALKCLDADSYDLVITDLMMPGMSGLEFIREMQTRQLGVQVVMVTAHATVASAVEAMRYGAFDYIEKPFDVEQIEQLVGRGLAHGRLLDRQQQLSGTRAGTSPTMVGSSPLMEALRQRIAQIAPTPETILIGGESGTGKELVAQSLHQASLRGEAPLVSLNCPVLSAQLLESELFGHERGAFTGADAARIGRFELADGGTILLDEVSEIDLSLQAKLLRVLQERMFERVGSSRTIHVDVRVLATTNRDLPAEVAAGRFREDLYYRLAVVPLHVPPLRARREDIPKLVDAFATRTAQRLGRPPCPFDAGAHDLLANYRWPGNVRELENIVTRASVLSDGQRVTADQLRAWLIEGGASDCPSGNTTADALPVGLSLEAMERRLIEATLEHYGGHRAKTAKALGIGIRTLAGKLKAYGYPPRARHFAKAG
jgi:DNA-binding NtrC family response regulator